MLVEAMGMAVVQLEGVDLNEKDFLCAAASTAEH